MKIGIVSCHNDILKKYFPTIAEPSLVPIESMVTPDDQIAVDALRKNNFQVQPIAWGAPIETLKSFDLLIIRSLWDYQDCDAKKTNFLNWINAVEQAGLLIVNPPNFIRWNLDKHYLQHLSEKEVNVIPTIYYEKKSTVNLQDVFNRRGSFIMKHCVSAGGENLFFIDSYNTAAKYQADINSLLRTNSFMMQNYIPEIKENGEWSLIFIANKYSHAIHKLTGKDSIFVHAERGGSFIFADKPKSSLIEFAKRVAAKVPEAFHYATKDYYNENMLLFLRIDIIETKRGLL